MAHRAVLVSAAAAWAAASVPRAEGLIRGLSAEDQASYPAGKPFQCKNTRGEQVQLPFASLNDDFCDCADGRDEPGTGACAGREVLFHCENAGSTPQLVYTSRVDDGICDCCDGSDEVGERGLRSCPNKCQEQGAVERQERADRVVQVTAGLKKRQDSVATAHANRDAWRAEVTRLKAELPALEAAHEEAKKAAQEAASNGQTEVERLKKQVADQQAKITELEAEVQRLRDGGDAGAGAGGKKAGEKKVVSEYAKWMEGAGETPGAVEGENPADPDMPDDEYTDEDHGVDDDGHEPPAPDTPAQAASGGSGGEDARVKEANSKVQQHKDTIRKREKSLKFLDDDAHIAYAGLEDKCISKHDGQYTYKLCFFKDSRQDHVNLGSWEGWEGLRKAKFTNGQTCPGGLARKMTAVFECGSEDEVLEVSEPSRCEYMARVTSPGACKDKDLERLQKPPVRHPKEEL